jgi:hypothetical protein
MTALHEVIGVSIIESVAAGKKKIVLQNKS